MAAPLAVNEPKLDKSVQEKNGASGKNRNGVPNIPIHRPESDHVDTHVTFIPTSSVKAAHPPVIGQDKVQTIEMGTSFHSDLL